MGGKREAMREWGGTIITKDRNNDEQIESTGRIGRTGRTKEHSEP